MMHPTFASILVSVTEGCHVGCAHCGFIGSSRERESDPAELAGWVAQACRYGVPLIIFTGGEPFERYDILQQGVRCAASFGVASAVFTSSYWARSAGEAVEMLGGLGGLRHLYLSTDVYHQQRVPPANVHHVIAAADRLGIPDITLCITYASERDRQAVRALHAAYEHRVRFHESHVIPTPFIGRALRVQDPMTTARAAHFSTRCWLETPIINPNGDVFACHAGKVGAHGPMEDLPYYLGNLRQIPFDDLMQRAGGNVEYQYLRTHGPRGVAELFEVFPHLGTAVGRAGFTGPCDLCFSTLATPEGRRCLHEYVRRPDVQTRINVRLALERRELPMSSGGTPTSSTAARRPAR